MAPSVIGAFAQASSSAGAASVGLAATSGSPAIGDYRLVFLNVGSSATIATPAGWTLHATLTWTNNSANHTYVFGRQFASGDGTTTFSFSVTALYGLTAIAIRGWNAQSVLDVSPIMSGTGANAATFSPTPITTNANNALHIDALAVTYSSSLTSAVLTAPSGMTSQATANGSSSTGYAMMIATEIVTPNGATPSYTYSASPTPASASGWAVVSLAVRPVFAATDTATGGPETLAVKRISAVADTATGSEALAITQALAVTDTATGSEALGVEQLVPKNATDSATGSESAAVLPLYAVTDTATGTESVGYVSTTTASDTATGAETVGIAATAAAADSALGSESVTLEQQRATTDTATGSDSAAILRSTTVVDAATGAESVDILRISAITDAAIGSEQTPKAGPMVFDSAHGSEFVQVEDIPFTRVLPLVLGVVYDLVVVARVPQAQGDPLLFEVDPIEWKTLTLVNELSQPQDLTATCQLSSLTAPIIERLASPATLPSELRLYRNGKIVFAGPLMGYQTNGETLTIKAQGLLAYLKAMTIVHDWGWVSTEQATIVRSLVDDWQNLSYGDFGLDTSGLLPTNVGRTVTYKAGELDNVLATIQAMGKLIVGFDAEVDPATRQLLIWSPKKGTDRSTGDDAIVFDERNVTASDTMVSTAFGDVATVAIVTSRYTGGDTTLYSVKTNDALMAQFGRVSITGTASDIKTQTGTDWFAQGLLDPRGDALYTPGPKVRVTPDADLPDYDIGDTVAYEFGGVLGISGAFRILKRTVNVGGNGREAVDLELV